MKNKLTIFLVCIALAGCTTAGSIQRNTDSQSNYAPVNASVSGAMTISYLNEGAGFVTGARREDAFKKMFNECSGKYKILEEWDGQSKVSTTVVQKNNTGFVASSFSSSYVTFVFECV